MNKTLEVYHNADVVTRFGLDPNVTGNVSSRNKLRMMSAKKVRGKNILDVGCGNGLLLEKLNGKLVGVDFSGSMLEEASKRQPNCTYVVASATHLPFKDKSFDTAVCIDMLHHLPTDSAQLSAIKELIRVSSKRAVFEIKTHDWLSPIRNFFSSILKYKHKTAESPLAGMQYHNASLKKIKKLLSSYKYKIQRVSFFVDWRLVTVRC